MISDPHPPTLNSISGFKDLDRGGLNRFSDLGNIVGEHVGKDQNRRRKEIVRIEDEKPSFFEGQDEEKIGKKTYRDVCVLVDRKFSPGKREIFNFMSS